MYCFERFKTYYGKLKIWVNKGSRFYNKPMKPWLHDNDIETYSTQNKGKCVVAERSIRTLKS